MNIEQVYIIDTIELLEKMMHDNDYSYDVYFRMAVIEEHLKQNRKIWDLYNKMQTIRVSEVKFIPKEMQDHKKEFIELINSISNNGYDFSQPIIINNDFYVIDGAHRIACSLFFGIPQVSVIIQEEYKNHIPKEYTKEWFLEHHLGECVCYAEEQKKKTGEKACIKVKKF